MLIELLTYEASFAEKLLTILIWLAALLPALTFHEWAHGFVAYKLGDSTAKADGRLSLNPLDHIDPLGALMLALVGFGWAKPVPVNTRSFKKPKRDIALVSAAGPLANFILAALSILLMVLLTLISFSTGFDIITMGVIHDVLYYSAMINLGLGFFNLIPLPPLDGSNIVMCLLPPRIAMKYSKLRYYSRYIFIGVLILSRMSFAYNPLSFLGLAQYGTFYALYQGIAALLAPLFGL